MAPLILGVSNINFVYKAGKIYIKSRTFVHNKGNFLLADDGLNFQGRSGEAVFNLVCLCQFCGDFDLGLKKGYRDQLTIYITDQGLRRNIMNLRKDFYLSSDVETFF